MNTASGNSILIGAFSAFSSASWRRSMRSCSAWARSTGPICMPERSAWFIAFTSDCSGPTCVRVASESSASGRQRPSEISFSVRRISSASGPVPRSDTRWSAPSSASPASIDTVIRSSVSGSERSIFSWRRVARPDRKNHGNAAPIAATAGASINSFLVRPLPSDEPIQITSAVAPSTRERLISHDPVARAESPARSISRSAGAFRRGGVRAARSSIDRERRPVLGWLAERLRPTVRSRRRVASRQADGGVLPSTSSPRASRKAAAASASGSSSVIVIP